jgi:hypothetical protein
MAKKTKAGRIRYALWLDLDVLDRLRVYQAELGVPVSESIRRALRTFVDTLKTAKAKKTKPADPAPV